MNSNTPIVPSTITEVKTITSIQVSIYSLELFTSVKLQVRLLDENNNLINTDFITISGADYDGWNNDDTYIINKAAEKLGFVIAS